MDELIELRSQVAEIKSEALAVNSYCNGASDGDGQAIARLARCVDRLCEHVDTLAHHAQRATEGFDKKDRAERLAANIAIQLFREGGRLAERLQFMHGHPASEVPGGGWCRGAVEDVVHQTIKREFADMLK